MLGREAIEGEQDILGAFEQLGDLGDRAAEAIEDLTEPNPGLLDALRVEDLAQRR